MNIVVAGLGGQGVLTASAILAGAAFEAGYDVKQAEVHGMNQRGGSVRTDIRFGEKVLSPMVTNGEADYLVILSADQTDVHRAVLKTDGTLITPDAIDESLLANKRSLNVALLGVLSKHLDLSEDTWQKALVATLPEKLHEANIEALGLGRSV